MSARSRRLDRRARKLRALANSTEAMLQSRTKLFYAITVTGRILASGPRKGELIRLVAENRSSVLRLHPGESVSIVTARPG